MALPGHVRLFIAVDGGFVKRWGNRAVTARAAWLQAAEKREKPARTHHPGLRRPAREMRGVELLP
jgi:hypothetical protein